MMHLDRALAAFACFTGLFCLSYSVGAQQVTTPGASSDPAQEIYQINEARRQDQIARQLDLNDRMTRSAGYGVRYPNPFEPWPRVPGDIWGYPQPRPIQQPIGHESIQTGPNRWIYRPVYAPPIPLARPVEGATPVATAAPAPQVNKPAQRGKVQLPGPSDLSDPGDIPSGLPPGAREF